MSSTAARLQRAPGFTVAVIRFRPRHQNEGFGILIHSHIQFHSSDDDTFTVSPEHIKLLEDKGVPFEFVRRS